MPPDSSRSSRRLQALALLAFVAVAAPAAAKSPHKVPQASPHAAPPAQKDVTIVNTPLDPVPVLDVGKPARQPFQQQTQVQVTGFLHDPLFSVPAGQRAVIETVSVQLNLPGTLGVGGVLSVETSVDGSPASHFLVLQSQGTVLTSEVRTANHAVRLYADPGTQIFLNGAVQAGSAVFVTLSGYLVDAP